MNWLEKTRELLGESQDIITEAVSENGNGLLAYICVVAEEFHKLKKYNPKYEENWKSLITSDAKFMKQVLSKVKIEYVQFDPYGNQREMMFDILMNNTLQVYATIDGDKNQEGSHPQMTNSENNVFRAVHDYIGHYNPNSKKFKKFVTDNRITSTEDSKFKSYRFTSHSFTVRGEMNTFLTHSKTVSPKAVPALFTEIIGQICTYFVTRNFTFNKVDIIKSIDFKNIGMFTSPELKKRKQNYINLLEDDSIESFKLNFGNVNIVKNTIKWNLISRGEGIKHKKSK